VDIIAGLSRKEKLRILERGAMMSYSTEQLMRLLVGEIFDFSDLREREPFPEAPVYEKHYSGQTHHCDKFIKGLRGNEDMPIITITGTPGSGKSTLAKLLAQRLGYQHYSMGDLQRKLAVEHGMTLQELLEKNATEEFTDKQVDEYQTKLGEDEDNFVIDSRLGFHFISQSIKLFIDADETIRAERLVQRESVAEEAKSVEHAIEMNKKRVENEQERYLKKYGVQPYDNEQYDLILNSSSMSPEALVAEILERFPELKK
jgi:cytidylate kinase